MKRNKWLTGLVILACAASVGLSGCTPQNAATGSKTAQEANGAYLSVTDDLGRQVTLAQKPQRVVVLSTSLLNFAAAVDGDLAGRATVKSEDASVPEKYQSVPEVGPVYNVSAEKIIALKPDLVLASSVQHQKLIPQLEENHIPVIALNLKTFDDVKRALTLVGQIYGKEDQAKQKINELDQQVQKIAQKVPQDGQSVAIIHATPSAVSVELSHSVAGDVAQILHLKNVAADAETKDNTERVPYSMESLVAKNPDVIFFTSMGPSDKIEKRIHDDIESNPAWGSLKAVQNGRVYVLPEHLFLLNPGLAYPQAVKFMAQKVYPEVSFDD